MTLLGALLLLLLVGPYLLPLNEQEGTQPAETLARPTGDFIRIGFPGTCGIQVYFEHTPQQEPDEETGAPETFILLHGFAANQTTWDDIRPFLAQSGQVYSYDRIPFGLSARLLPADWTKENPYTDEAAVVQLLALMDAWHIERATLVGNSAGGTIAMMAALAHPERVRRLILLSPAVFSGSRRPLGVIARVPPLRRIGLLGSRRIARSGSLLDLAYHDPKRITEQRRRDAALMARVPDWDRAFWEYLQASQPPRTLREHLGELSLPVLLITGDDDRVIPTRETVKLQQQLPDAAISVLTSCGHLPQNECPAQVIGAIQRWQQNLL